MTDIAGTTRDCIEEEILIEGIPFKIIDTAGIRDTDNKIEQIGIEKAKALLEKSDLIIAIFDNSKDFVLPIPHYENKVFGGWYDNSECQGEKVTFIPAGTTSNQKYYALWQ